MKLPHWVRTAINIAFLATVLVFSAAYVSKLDWAKLSGIKIGIPYMLLSLTAGVGYLFLASFIWIRMLYRLNPEVRPSWDLLAVYAKSWMGRYIPGKVAWIAGKIHFASSRGIPASQLGITSFLEAGVQMATQLIISLAIVLADGHFSNLPEGIRIITLLAIIGLVIALLPPVFNAATGLLVRLAKKQVENNLKITFTAVGEMTGLYSLGFILLGVSYFFSLKSFMPDLSPGLFAFTTAGISIAGTMGVLALFAPSGLGVREGFIVLFLSMAMPIELAVVSALVLRATAFVMDLAFLGACVAGRVIFGSNPTEPLAIDKGR
jgi:glycosyltransferase 2 family protein